MGLLDSILGSALGGSEGQGGARDPKVALLIGLVTMLMSRQGGAAQGGGDGGGLLGSLGSILGSAGGGAASGGLGGTARRRRATWTSVRCWRASAKVFPSMRSG